MSAIGCDRKPPVLAIVAPCYNEEETLETSSAKLVAFIRDEVAKGSISSQSYVLYVDDGSKDSTWEIIKRLNSTDKECAGLRLSANEGQQNALLAGMEAAIKNADIVVTIDVDLQDDYRVISEMVSKYISGAEVVYGVRSKRDTDTWFKRNTAQGFYKLMNSLGVRTIYNHADFRMMSRRAVEALLQYGERNMFIRGIVPSIGFSQDVVYFERQKRELGVTKYPLKKMVNFALDGITSFSVRPVRMLFAIGLVFLLVALGILTYVLINYFTGKAVSGWSSMILSIWFCSGVLLTAMAIVGEYIGKIYIEVKQRPRYFIDTYLQPESQKECKDQDDQQD